MQCNDDASDTINSTLKTNAYIHTYYILCTGKNFYQLTQTTYGCCHHVFREFCYYFRGTIRHSFMCVLSLVISFFSLQTKIHSTYSTFISHHHFHIKVVRKLKWHFMMNYYQFIKRFRSFFLSIFNSPLHRYVRHKNMKIVSTIYIKVIFVYLDDKWSLSVF